MKYIIYGVVFLLGTLCNAQVLQHRTDPPINEESCRDYMTRVGKKFSEGAIKAARYKSEDPSHIANLKSIGENLQYLGSHDYNGSYCTAGARKRINVIEAYMEYDLAVRAEGK